EGIKDKKPVYRNEFLVEVIKKIMDGGERKAKLNILCVCNYNYNRSPAMEMVFDYFIKKEKLENYIEVNSGGAQEENKNGWGATNQALTEAFSEIFNAKPKKIISKSLSIEQVRNADIIVVANEEVLNTIKERFKGLLKGKHIFILEKLKDQIEPVKLENKEKKRILETKQIIEKILWPEIIRIFINKCQEHIILNFGKVFQNRKMIEIITRIDFQKYQNDNALLNEVLEEIKKDNVLLGELEKIEIYIVNPSLDQTQTCASPFIWYESPSKFVIAARIDNEIYLPYSLLTLFNEVYQKESNEFIQQRYFYYLKGIIEYLLESKENKKQADSLSEEVYLLHHEANNILEDGVIDFIKKTTENLFGASSDEKKEVLGEIIGKMKKAKGDKEEVKENEDYELLKSLLQKDLKKNKEGRDTQKEIVDKFLSRLNVQKIMEGKNGKLRIKDIVLLPKEGILYVIGDTHGDSESTDWIIDRIRKDLEEKRAFVVFLGDYVNNGLNSVENLIKVLQLKEKFPERVVLLSGNHEFRETWWTVLNEYFNTHWKNATKYPFKNKSPPNHYSHIRLELAERFGIEKGEELYELFEEWGRSLPFACFSAKGVMMSHSIGLPKNLIEKLENGKIELKELFRKFIETKQDNEDLELFNKLGYEAWRKQAQTIHSRMVNNRNITPGLLEIFKKLGIKVFIIGHSHYRSGDIHKEGWLKEKENNADDIQDEGRIVTICSSDKNSATSGHYMHQEFWVESQKEKEKKVKDGKEEIMSGKRYIENNNEEEAKPYYVEISEEEINTIKKGYLKEISIVLKSLEKESDVREGESKDGGRTSRLIKELKDKKVSVLQVAVKALGEICIRLFGRELLGGRLDGGSRKSLLFSSSGIQLSNKDGGFSLLSFPEGFQIVQETIKSKLNQLLQLIKGYKITAPPELERIPLDDKFSDGGDVSDLSPAIQELSKDKSLRILQLSFQSPLFKLEGAEINPTINIPMINNPILILKEILNLAKNSVAKAAATITGKVLRINFVINHLFPSIDSKTITQKDFSVKLGATVSISNSKLNQFHFFTITQEDLKKLLPSASIACSANPMFFAFARERGTTPMTSVEGVLLTFGIFGVLLGIIGYIFLHQILHEKIHEVTAKKFGLRIVDRDFQGMSIRGEVNLLQLICIQCSPYILNIAELVVVGTYVLYFLQPFSNLLGLLLNIWMLCVSLHSLLSLLMLFPTKIYSACDGTCLWWAIRKWRKLGYNATYEINEEGEWILKDNKSLLSNKDGGVFYLSQLSQLIKGRTILKKIDVYLNNTSKKSVTISTPGVEKGKTFSFKNYLDRDSTFFSNAVTLASSSLSSAISTLRSSLAFISLIISSSTSIFFQEKYPPLPLLNLSSNFFNLSKMYAWFLATPSIFSSRLLSFSPNTLSTLKLSINTPTWREVKGLLLDFDFFVFIADTMLVGTIEIVKEKTYKPSIRGLRQASLSPGGAASIYENIRKQRP
ncbi:MAG: hypothetical protein DRP81_06495, partial [Candidatus Omnitrophota bacterium]